MNQIEVLHSSGGDLVIGAARRLSEKVHGTLLLHVGMVDVEAMPSVVAHVCEHIMAAGSAPSEDFALTYAGTRRDTMRFDAEAESVEALLAGLLGLRNAEASPATLADQAAVISHEESLRTRTRPIARASTLAFELLYGAAHPYSRDPAGSAADLAQISQADINCFMRDAVLLAPLTLSVIGADLSGFSSDSLAREPADGGNKSNLVAPAMDLEKPSSDLGGLLLPDRGDAHIAWPLPARKAGDPSRDFRVAATRSLAHHLLGSSSNFGFTPPRVDIVDSWRGPGMAMLSLTAEAAARLAPHPSRELENFLNGQRKYIRALERTRRARAFSDPATASIELINSFRGESDLHELIDAKLSMEQVDAVTPAIEQAMVITSG